MAVISVLLVSEPLPGYGNLNWLFACLFERTPCVIDTANQIIVRFFFCQRNHINRTVGKILRRIAIAKAKPESFAAPRWSAHKHMAIKKRVAIFACPIRRAIVVGAARKNRSTNQG